MDTNKSEITAEWTVRAHLTITRPTENLLHRVPSVRRDNDSVTTDGRASEPRNVNANVNDNPVRVVYKWCSDDIKNANEAGYSDGHSSFRRGNFLVAEGQCNKNDSFVSTGVPASDSGVSSSTTNASTNKSALNARFRSTCNIILSASTDLIPKANELCDDVSTRCHTSFPDQEVLFLSANPS